MSRNGSAHLCFVLQRGACEEQAVLMRDRAEMLEQTGCWVLQSVGLIYHHHLIVTIIIIVVVVI